MDHGGWIKLYRKEIDSAIWEKPPLYHRVWHWLLINADYTTGEWTGTYQGIANGVRWTERNKQITPSIPQIRKIIAFLRSVRSLATGRSGVGSGVILSLTIVNWDTYQNSKQEVGQGLGQGFDHRTVRVGTPPSNYIERVQEVKKLRSKEVPPDMVVESTSCNPPQQNSQESIGLQAVKQINDALGRTGMPIKKHREELNVQMSRIGMVGILNAIKPEKVKREILNAKDYWPYALAIIARYDPAEASHRKEREKVWMPPDSAQLEARRKEMAKKGIPFLEPKVYQVRKAAQDA